ncbi:MAG: hypothetical protein MKZ95_10980 [Pirellulales bacterium]|nr:hypothetical protein [Pirellulales bacterium]
MSDVKLERASRRDRVTLSGSATAPSQPDIVKTLSDQLVLMEKQREQLQQLLDETQG